MNHLNAVDMDRSPPSFGIVGLAARGFLVACTLLAVVSCGGGGGGGEPPNPPSATFRLSTATPEADSVIRSDSVFTLTFSEAVDPATATAEHVELTLDGTPIPANVSATGRTVTVTPSLRLRLLTTYTLNIKEGLKSLSGAALVTPYSLTFQTPRAVFAFSSVVPVSDFYNGGAVDFQMAVFDSNGDGLQDVATLTRPESVEAVDGYTIQIYRQGSRGDFSRVQRIEFPIPLQNFTINFPAFLAIDVDLDGVDELVVAEDQPGEDASKANEWPYSGLRVFKRGSDGHFAQVAYVRTAYAQGVRMGDVDGDGNPDLVGVRRFDARFLGYDDRGFQVMLSRPGGLQIQPPVQVSGDLAIEFVMTDLDRDGDLDLLFPRPAGNLIYAGNGDGSFQFDSARSETMVPLCSTFCEQLLVLDLNGDDFPDFVANSIDGPHWISRTDGSYAAETPPRLPGIGGRMLPASGDIDKDGFLDLVWIFGGGSTSPTSYVPLFGGNTGQLTPSVAEDLREFFSGGSLPADAMLLVDVDGDGYLDILLGTYNSGVQLWRQLPD